MSAARADAAAARAVYVAPAPVVAAPVKLDMVSQLLRFRPARIALLIYLPLVHLFLFALLYSRMLVSVK